MSYDHTSRKQDAASANSTAGETTPILRSYTELSLTIRRQRADAYIRSEMKLSEMRRKQRKGKGND